MPTPSAELEVLFRIAARVHLAVRQALGNPQRFEVVAMGASGTPTERIDRLAEDEVRAVLEEEKVDWNLLSEEVGRVERGGQLTLVLDPIDGSHNALRGLPFATVSLAVGTDTMESVSSGVVHDLTTGVTYWATKGQGAFRDGRPLHTRPWEARRELFFLNLGRHATPRVIAWASQGRRVRSLGCASLEMLAVAQGSADAYLFENDVEERNLRVTDIAASYRILLEAGGGVSDLNGAPIDSLGLSLDRRTSVFAWADERLHAAAKGGVHP
ncbi:MAG: fructose-1,6-bisphosphatase [Thermoplasmata archaeon]|nr:fructose-1,6-bisphosphatase [Thermoplasmata archaeon]